MCTIKNWKRVFLEFYDNFNRGVSLTGTLTTSAGGIPGGVKDIGFEIVPGKRYGFEPYPVESAGIAGAIDLESISPDFTLERLHIAAEERTVFGA
jgi:hypothetical protein